MASAAMFFQANLAKQRLHLLGMRSKQFAAWRWILMLGRIGARLILLQNEYMAQVHWLDHTAVCVKPPAFARHCICTSRVCHPRHGCRRMNAKSCKARAP